MPIPGRLIIPRCEPMPVHPEDNILYLDFARKIADKIGFADDVPDVVWHYTSAAGLIGILHSGSIFATQLACLNDQTELRYAISLLRNALQQLRNHSGNDEDIDYLLDLVAKSAGVDVAPESPYFVSCFSRHADDLSQWRAYGGGENGYALGFETRHLISAHSLIAKVNYDRALHEDIATQVAAAFLIFFKEGMKMGRAASREIWVVEFAAAWEAAMGKIGPMLKDPAFEAEGEFRCIHRLEIDERKRIQFRQKQGLLARHLPLDFPPPGRPRSEMLPIVEVIVGPCRHPSVSKSSVDELLRQKGYGNMTKTSVSKIPFQVT